MTPRRLWPPGLALAAAVLVGRWLRRVEVAGDSMRPTLEPGDRLVLWAPPAPRARPGDLVAVVDPREAGRTVVKRLAEVGPGGLTVLGDNPGASTDSRTFGPVRRGDLRGRAVYRYHPPSRRARLGRVGPVTRPGER